MNSGSYFMNYKGFFSIVLMALVDADYKFINVNVGAAGRESDGGVFQNTSICRGLEDNSCNVPDPTPLTGSTIPIPYVIVADDAFPLKTNLMKPYSSRNLTHEKQVFNYRLSRCRRISENAFGIMAGRFRVLRHSIQLQPKSVVRIILAACTLHNFLRSVTVSRDSYTPSGVFDYEDLKQSRIIDGSWRADASSNGLQPMATHVGNRSASNALQIRDMFCAYFNGVGAVPWQDEMILKH
jgi:hypothetical protein